jgi:intracellular septation protein A
MNYWTYRRRFTVEGRKAEVVINALLQGGLRSELRLDGSLVAQDATPSAGAEAVRNHRLAATLEDGRRLEVEAGYLDWIRMGIAARLDGALIHESHPGKTIAFPASMRGFIEQSVDPGKHFRKNGPAIAVDIALAVLFFATAKLFGLSTAALVGAGAGLALIVAQRFVKVDIIGGMALFGVVTLLLAAGYSLAFQDEEAVKMRTTVIGLISAGFFLADAAFGGRWLGKGMARYMPFEHLDVRRLAFGLGITGGVMAGLNLLVARNASTDVWLFYTTFGDIPLAAVMALTTLKWARSGPRPKASTAAA